MLFVCLFVLHHLLTLLLTKNVWLIPTILLFALMIITHLSFNYHTMKLAMCQWHVIRSQYESSESQKNVSSKFVWYRISRHPKYTFNADIALIAKLFKHFLRMQEAVVQTNLSLHCLRVSV